MSLTRFRIYFLAVLLLVLWVNAGPVFASHIVGGEITYRCMGNAGGNNMRYEIELTIYQDCLTGSKPAIDDDVPAFLGIYDLGTGDLFTKDLTLQPAANQLVPPNFNNNCVKNPPATCLNKVVFRRQYVLPINGSGYLVTYQRCCRNASVINIVQPESTGATYFCTIPSATAGLCNNSALFRNYPPQIICINNPLVYDHSATDADGDILTYEFCESYIGGSQNDAKPEPPFKLTGLPPTVVYQGFYSAVSPIGGSPQIKIDSKTGLITGVPNMMGRYVVTVCCNEWRNGVIINTVKREFQFVVTNCSKAVVADMPYFSEDQDVYLVNCKDRNVKFINHSTGGFDYFWDFGDGSTSTAFEPEHTYADTGIYVARLIVNQGSTCPDSTKKFVKVFPMHEADLAYSGSQCPNTPVSFFDSTNTTYGPVTRWLWNFGDGVTASEQHPVHAFQNGGVYNVTLISGNVKGCLDTFVKDIVIDSFTPFAGYDTIIVKGEYVNFAASGGVTYLWTPPTNLSNPNISNPSGFYPDLGRFNYNVNITSDFGCVGSDSIQVWVVDQGSLFVPSAFTPNGDGMNDFLKPFAVGYSKVNFFGVFNRWGERVFTSDNFTKGWDGRFKGKMAPMDNYYWLLKVTDKDGKEETRKGDVTLIR